jgi:hypothetical protein
MVQKKAERVTANPPFQRIRPSKENGFQDSRVDASGKSPTGKGISTNEQNSSKNGFLNLSEDRGED